MLGGLDVDNPSVFVRAGCVANLATRVVGPVRREGPVQARDVEFLRRHTERRIKITVPGPFTMGQQTQDDHYGDEQLLALDLAAAQPRIKLGGSKNGESSEPTPTEDEQASGSLKPRTPHITHHPTLTREPRSATPGFVEPSPLTVASFCDFV
jgi:hypothetical protein